MLSVMKNEQRSINPFWYDKKSCGMIKYEGGGGEKKEKKNMSRQFTR